MNSMRATPRPSWIYLDHRVDRPVDGGESAGGHGHRFGQAVQAQGHLGDHAQRALGADEQPGEVVPRARLARPRTGLDDAAVGQHHGEAQHILAHGSIAHRRGSRGPRGSHAADRRVGARIDKECEPGVLECLGQLHAAYACFDRRVHVLDAHAHNAVHLPHVEAKCRRAPRAHGPRATCRPRTEPPAGCSAR